MERFKDYIDKETEIISISFGKDVDGYFLLFNKNDNFSKILKEFFKSKLNKPFTVKQLREKFWKIDTLTNNNIDLNTESAHSEILKKMSKTIFKSNTFIVLKDSNSICVDMDIIKNINKVSVLGVLFIEQESLNKLLMRNKLSLTNFKEEEIDGIYELVEGTLGATLGENLEADEGNDDELGLGEEDEDNLNKEFEGLNEEENENDYDPERDENELYDDLNNEDEFEDDLDERMKSSHMKDAVDKAINVSGQPKSKRHRKQHEEESMHNNVTSFITKLREAEILDEKALKNGKPALNKYKLLPLMEKFLSNFVAQKYFLDANGLERLENWIKRNSDGSYPPFNQISKVLDILSSLPVNVSYLQASTIGLSLNNIAKNLVEAKQIQRKAAEIVQKWLRIVYEINTNYEDIDTENRNYMMVFQKKRMRGNNSNNNGNENAGEKRIETDESNIYKHAKIPKKGFFDFTVRPMPKTLKTDVQIKPNIRNLIQSDKN